MELERQKNLVPVEKVLNALKNVGGKKSNAFYRAKIDYNKRNSILIGKATQRNERRI
jgi:hypothetical protein